MSSLRYGIRLLGAATFGVVLALSAAAHAQRGDAGDLRRAYDAALTSAKGSDSLDPAYELLGIAGTARSRGDKDISASASVAFVDLIQRATATALRKGGAVAQDNLDQLVDLRFFARTTEVQQNMAALDSAMRSLFPAVSGALQRKIDAVGDWDERVSALGDLASLQASAVQVMLDDIAETLGQAFDSKRAVLEKRAAEDTDDADRARKLGDLAEAKRSRSEQLADAVANNVNAIAAQMQSNGRGNGQDSLVSEAGANVAPELAAGDTSCIETGYRAADPKRQRDHDRECVNAGRVPSTARCSLTGLTFACYAKLPNNGEKITYVYRNTPEEAYFRKACPASDLVPASKIPKAGAPFRSSDTALAFICAPSGGETSGD